MRLTTEGLVIKEKNLGESDRLVTILTRNNGVIHAYASGAKSIKSKRGAATSLLTYSNFTLDQKNDTYRITEASPIRVFFGAGSDILCLSLSQYFCELCAIVVPQETDSEEFLRLILNSLHFLTEKERHPLQIKALTELRIAALSGFCPDLVACAECGKFEDQLMFFDLQSGRILCSECGAEQNLIPLGLTEITAMRHIIFSEFSKLYSFEIPPQAAARLSDATERYLITQTDHHFYTLDFYHSVCAVPEGDDTN